MVVFMVVFPSSPAYYFHRLLFLVFLLLFPISSFPCSNSSYSTPSPFNIFTFYISDSSALPLFLLPFLATSSFSSLYFRFLFFHLLLHYHLLFSSASSFSTSLSSSSSPLPPPPPLSPLRLPLPLIPPLPPLPLLLFFLLFLIFLLFLLLFVLLFILSPIFLVFLVFLHVLLFLLFLLVLLLLSDCFHPSCQSTSTASTGDRCWRCQKVSYWFHLYSATSPLPPCLLLLILLLLLPVLSLWNSVARAIDLHSILDHVGHGIQKLGRRLLHVGRVSIWPSTHLLSVFFDLSRCTSFSPTVKHWIFTWTEDPLTVGTFVRTAHGPWPVFDPTQFQRNCVSATWHVKRGVVRKRMESAAAADSWMKKMLWPANKIQTWNRDFFARLSSALSLSINQRLVT